MDERTRRLRELLEAMRAKRSRWQHSYGSLEVIYADKADEWADELEAVLDTDGDRPPQFPYPMNKEDHRLDCDIRTSRDGWDANCTCQAQEIRRWQDMDRKREEVFQRVIEQRNQLLKENKELRKVKANVR